VLVWNWNRETIPAFRFAASQGFCGPASGKGREVAGADGAGGQEEGVPAVEGTDVVLDYAAAWSAHDVNALLAVFTDDCIFEDVTLGVTNRGKEELKAFAETFFRFAPDLRLEITRSGSFGGFGACEWIFSGTQRQEFMGKPATGKRWSFRGAGCFEVADDGKIKRWSDYWNLAAFLEQLG
jgi:steroid delta-isomerase-like uncharacterized protein